MTSAPCCRCHPSPKPLWPRFGRPCGPQRWQSRQGQTDGPVRLASRSAASRSGVRTAGVRVATDDVALVMAEATETTMKADILVRLHGSQSAIEVGTVELPVRVESVVGG